MEEHGPTPNVGSESGVTSLTAAETVRKIVKD